MQEVTVQLARHTDPPLEVLGFGLEEVPGLVITESIDSWDAVWPLPERPWNITHAPSGRVVVHCKDKDHAQQVLAELGRLSIDWNVPQEKVMVSKADLETFRLIRREAHQMKEEAEFAAFGPPEDDEDDG